MIEQLDFHSAGTVRELFVGALMELDGFAINTKCKFLEIHFGKIGYLRWISIGGVGFGNGGVILGKGRDG